METVLIFRRSSMHADRSRWTRHDVESERSPRTRCGLRLDQVSSMLDLASVRGEVRDCKRCERIARHWARMRRIDASPEPWRSPKARMLYIGAVALLVRLHNAMPAERRASFDADGFPMDRLAKDFNACGFHVKLVPNGDSWALDSE